MNRGAWRLLLLCFLFVFGLLFGLESKKSNVTKFDARDTFIDTNQYISRIENGQFVFKPIHQQSAVKPNMDLTKTYANEEIVHEVEEPQVEEGPKMNKKGKLDQIGQKLGSKFSQLTRKTLETSMNLFTK